MTGKAKRGQSGGDAGEGPAAKRAAKRAPAKRAARHAAGDEPATPDSSAPVDPVDAAAAAILADPEFMQRRLDADLAAVSALGRGEVRVDPSLPAERLVLAVREQADRLGFGSPVLSAVEAMEHIDELPLSERETGEPIEAYHRSASLTVANGEVVREHVGFDASTSVIFHRRAAEPNDTSVRLEAVVGIETDGRTHLTGYGWPTVDTDQPVYAFNGPAQGYAAQVVADLRTSVERSGADAATGGRDAGTAGAGGAEAGTTLTTAADDPVTRGYFERAMLMAFGLAIAQQRDGYLTEEQLAAYQRDVVTLVAQSARRLIDYLETAFELAEQGGAVGWTGACVRRSAVEGLFAGFLGSAAFELIDPELLNELHEQIDEAAMGLRSPGPPPVGVPRHNHDWWFPGRSA